MRSLSRQRCFNHAHREAVARCPECRRYYCRECVTEHEDRVVCASCLAYLAAEQEEQGSRLAVIGRMALCALGILTLWLFFYTLGEGLLALPSSFHEGSIWKTGYWEPE